MSTPSNNSKLEYKVVRFDVDANEAYLSEGLSKLGAEGWKLINSYHIHHLGSNFFVFSREISS